MYPNWNLEELEYWKIAAYPHFSLRGFELLGAEASRLRLILLVDIVSVARRPLSQLLCLTYDASHCKQLLGGSEAEVLEGKVCRKLRTVERGVRCAVGLAVDVDEASLVDVGIALRGSLPLLVCGILYKEIVLVAIMCECAVKIVAYGDAFWLSGKQFEVDARLGVGINRSMVLAVSHGKG